MEEIMSFSAAARESTRLLPASPVQNYTNNAAPSNLVQVYKKSVPQKDYQQKQKEVTKAINASQFSAGNLDIAIDNLILVVCSKVVALDPLEKIQQSAQVLSEVFQDTVDPKLESSKRTQLAQHFDARAKAYLFKMTMDDPQFIDVVHDLPVIHKMLNRYSVFPATTSVAAVLGSQFSPQDVLKRGALYGSDNTGLSGYISKREKQIYKRLERKIQTLVEKAKTTRLNREEIKTSFNDAEWEYIDEAKFDQLVDALERVNREFIAPSNATQKELEIVTEEYRKSYAQLQQANDDIPWAFRWKDVYMQITPSRTARAFKTSELYSSRPQSTLPSDLPSLPMKRSTAEQNPPRREDFEQIKNLAGQQHVNLGLKQKLKGELDLIASQRFEGKRGEIHQRLCQLLQPYTEPNLYMPQPLSSPTTVKDAKQCETQLIARTEQVTKQKSAAGFVGAELQHLQDINKTLLEWVTAQTEYENALNQKQSELSAVEDKLDDINNSLQELGFQNCIMTPLYYESFYLELGLKDRREASIFVRPSHPLYGTGVLAKISSTVAPLWGDKVDLYNEQRKKTFEKEQSYNEAWKAHYQATIGWEMDLQKSIGILPASSNDAQTLAKGLANFVANTGKVKADVQNIPTDMQKNIQTIFEETIKTTWEQFELQKPTDADWRKHLAIRLFDLISKINRNGPKVLTHEDLALLDMAKKYLDHVELSKEQKEAIRNDDGSWSRTIEDAYTALLTGYYRRILAKQ
ncbi:MAG: hypothetical protein JSR58_07780 [Verrucomicrobia bacterium]|nr:hypothetical protein [Verrucomicrobiota bacterium]